MTPERVVRLVLRWVRFYTRELPPAIAGRRVEEVGADLHDHIVHERGRGTSDRRIALDILSRMARGLPADASWRRRVRPLKGHPMKTALTILAALLVTAIGIAAIVAGEADDSPGLQLLGALLVVGTVAFGVKRAKRST